MSKIITTAVQTWQYSPVTRPIFFERINGRLRRVSHQRGLQMIDEGILYLTATMKRYLQGEEI